jgi:hypothetical protein
MASIHNTSSQKQSNSFTTSNFIIRQITVVGMVMDFIILSLMATAVIYPHHWSSLPAPGCTMLAWSGQRTTVFIWRLRSHSCIWTHLIAQTTLTVSLMVVSMHPAVVQWVGSCSLHLELQTHIHSCWIPATHYLRATNRWCIKTLLLQSIFRSTRRRTQYLQWSLA